MFATNYQDKLIETLEKINITLESFSNTTKNSEKGGEKVMNKFEELLAKYSKTIDEVTFEYENLSDEELEVAFKEAFGEVEEEIETVVEETVVVEETSVEEPIDEDTVVVEEPVVEETTVEDPVENFVLQYELSHDDIRYALYNLLSADSDDKFYYVWILEVFDNKFIYEDYEENKFYRQGYTKDGDTVALDGDKVEVFNEWLSKEEKDALDTLKTDYAVLKAFKDNYDATELHAQREAILNANEYSVLADNDEFKALASNMDNYSIDDLKIKADLIFASHVKTLGEFSAKKDETKTIKSIGFNFNKKESKKGPYGNLFNK
jgi:hypothetical protein